MTNFRLSTTEQRQMNEDGFVLRHDVFDPREVNEIIRACETLVNELVSNRQENRLKVGSYVFDRDDDKEVTIKWEGDTDIVHGIEPFAHLSDDLRRWALDERFTDPMIDFVGDERPILFTEKLNLKRPFHGGHNPLHQDMSYWKFADDRNRIATAMLFLDESTVENGTLQVIPGSHKLGVWKRRTDKDAGGNLEIDPNEEVGKTLMPIEVKAGAVVFFGSYLVHKSTGNNSPKERRTLLYSYQPNGYLHANDAKRRLNQRLATGQAKPEGYIHPGISPAERH